MTEYEKDALMYMFTGLCAALFGIICEDIYYVLGNIGFVIFALMEVVGFTYLAVDYIHYAYKNEED